MIRFIQQLPTGELMINASGAAAMAICDAEPTARRISIYWQSGKPDTILAADYWLPSDPAGRAALTKLIQAGNEARQKEKINGKTTNNRSRAAVARPAN